MDTRLDVTRRRSRILSLHNEEKVVELRFRSVAVCESWLVALQAALARSRVENPYRSVAPVRENSLVTWLVEGRTVFATIAYAIMAAKSSIFISGV